MAVTHYSQRQRARRLDQRLRNGGVNVQELIVPKGKTEKAKAQWLDERLRKLAHADAARGVIMFELRMPDATGKRPLFQHLSEHGMNEDSTFAEYVDTVHNLSRSQAQKDIRAALCWAAINGCEPARLADVPQEVGTPSPTHLNEVSRLMDVETQAIPDSLGKQAQIPVRAKNPKLIAEAWEHIQESHETAVVEAAKEHAADPDTNGEDFKPPKLTTTRIRNYLAKPSKKGNFYDRAGVEAPVSKKPKGKIGRICGLAENLANQLQHWEEDYEDGIAGVAHDDGWNKTQRNAAIRDLQRAGEQIDIALGRLEDD